MKMASRHDFNFYSSDSDDGVDADLEAFKRAFSLIGGDPTTATTTDAALETARPTFTSAYQSDLVEDDLELARSIHRRFGLSTNILAAIAPFCSSPVVGSDDDDYNDDLETLRAIQYRFAAYDDEKQKSSPEDDNLQVPKEFGATNTDSEKEMSDNLFLEQTHTVEEFPDIVAASDCPSIPESSGSNVAVIQSHSSFESHEIGAGNAASSPARASSFPKSAQAYFCAIKKNRVCQRFIRSKLMQIEARIEENKNMRKRVLVLKDFQVNCRKRTTWALSQKMDARVQLISVLKLRANSRNIEAKVPAMYYGPAENSHVNNYRVALTKFPLSLTREKWTKEEDQKLASGINQQFRQMMVQKSIDLIRAAEGFVVDSNDIDKTIVSIGELDFPPEKIRLFLPNVNWEQVASVSVSGRSGAECEARWLNFGDPLINHDRQWSKSEDKHLLFTVQQEGMDNWIHIAALGGMNRTPFQCLARYQRSLNASILKREWTEDEDNRLRKAVRVFGESNWQRVASAVGGRTGPQCSNRWIKSLHPARERVGKWTLDENKRLTVSVMLFGAKSWRKIAQFVPGRTHVQCRERWVNSLDPSLNLGPWSEEEDSRLKAAIEEHGYCWAKVAVCIAPRTDSQCRRRWMILLPHEVPLLQDARKMQKAALISNFVDRESERPALGPADFSPVVSTDSVPESEITNPSRKRRRKSRGENQRPERSSRSKRPRKNACVGSGEASSPSKGDESHNADNATLNNKKARTRRAKNKGLAASTQDCVPPCVGTLLASN